mmetsp:Transcript_15364/g.23003  ORF Transcript_15364/g.23003 Transcript_15364/m.23003 type:complete len:421 (-) Transcript_15364:25-1287(-)|eukprot:CAMPEP_0201552888 /NCGR_PEP_ID=MMETSP0173_2-20130828/19061_1 /ASSEMBLY_ACC=CAM_ASM_000268 /TAXON_ID=218659 /ORGANISM="Vexillifera sp., Strain DIVA3 564/2" /LENGTH=420 /DNA_ID=CAMNT_0047963469 /DNA_START=15 /DNA_END=1277 /DNA_ORIENTATION=+
MKLFALFVVFLCALSHNIVFAQESDACLDESVARSSVNKALQINDFAQLAYSAQNREEISSLFESIEAVLSPLSNPFYVNLFVGLANDNFYGFYVCGKNPKTFCTTDEQVYYTTRNTDVFGDAKWHAFPTLADLRQDGTEVVSDADYPTTQRSWYVRGTDPSEPDQFWEEYIFFSSGRLGQSAIDRSLYVASTGLVIGADRDSTEPCAWCLERLSLRATTEAVATSERLGAFLAAADDTQARQRSVDLLLPLFRTAERTGEVGYLFFGLPNGNFYGVFTCTTNPLDVACEADEASGLILAVRDASTPATQGEQTRIYFNIDDDGVVGTAPVQTAGPYDSSSRAWYQTGTGWSAPYSYTCCDLVARSYVFAFNGGVVGADPQVGAIDDSCDGKFSCSNGATIAPVTILLVALTSLMLTIFY